MYLDSICVPTIDLNKYGYDVVNYKKKYCKSINNVIENCELDNRELETFLGLVRVWRLVPARIWNECCIAAKRACR